jgi:hypothetical protein
LLSLRDGEISEVLPFPQGRFGIVKRLGKNTSGTPSEKTKQRIRQSFALQQLETLVNHELSSIQVELDSATLNAL